MNKFFVRIRNLIIKPKTIPKGPQLPGRGHVWNPLRKFPPNSPCFCGSFKKAKQCCLPKLSRTMEKRDANAVLYNWDGILKGKTRLEQYK